MNRICGGRVRKGSPSIQHDFYLVKIHSALMGVHEIEIGSEEMEIIRK
jgi:hypothetical protein